MATVPNQVIIKAMTVGEFLNETYQTTLSILDRHTLESDLYNLQEDLEDTVVKEKSNKLKERAGEAITRMISERNQENAELLLEYELVYTDYLTALSTHNLDLILTFKSRFVQFLQDNGVDHQVGISINNEFHVTNLYELGERNSTEIKDEIQNILSVMEKLDESVNYGILPSILPVEGEISSGFGYRIDPFTQKPALHSGLDIAAQIGTKVHAVFNGTITTSGSNETLGEHMIAQVGDVNVLYAHLNKRYFEVGESVIQGMEIGEVGNTGRSTGPHLHLGLYIKGIAVDPYKLFFRS
jgi:murein DD-endopeptidase MepM/ murein hydrolase activator NlpD